MKLSIQKRKETRTIETTNKGRSGTQPKKETHRIQPRIVQSTDTRLRRLSSHSRATVAVLAASIFLITNPATKHLERKGHAAKREHKRKVNPLGAPAEGEIPIQSHSAARCIQVINHDAEIIAHGLVVVGGVISVVEMGRK